MNSPPNSCFYEFEGFVLDPLQRVLRTLTDGQTVNLTARAFDTLHLLVSHHGQLVDKETLIKALWPKVVVEDNNLTQIIHALRQSLGEKPGEHRFIATAPGRGYRFVAAVKEVPRASTDSNSEPTTVPPSGSAEPMQVPTTIPPELTVPAKTRTGGMKFRSLLRWGALAMALIVMASAWWALQRNGATSTTSTQQPTTVAVLPFVNLTGDASKEYLGDGMAEELINTLTKVPGLKVPARTSSFSYKGRNVDVRQIAKELGVGMVVEGSVRSAGEEIRITAQLINAEDGLHLWSETYDEPFTELFKLQDRLAKEIATALHVNLKGNGETAIASKPPAQDVEAYRLYLQGRELIQRPTLRNVQQALELFHQAIARDAKFAGAYTGIADAHLTLLNALNQPEPPNVLAAERAVRQALALDPDSAYALAVLATVNGLRGQYLEAELASQASLKLDTGDGWIYIHRAFLVNQTGMQGEIVRVVLRAYNLAPGNPAIVAALACTYGCRGGFDAEARKFEQLAMDLGYPPQGLALRNLRYNETLRSKRYGEAAEILAGMVDQADPEYARTTEVIRATHAALADPAKRAAALATYARLYPRRAQRAARSAAYDRPKSINGANCTSGANSYALLGELDIAYELANYCLDTGASSPVAAGRRLWTPELRSFRQDPRFQAYVSRFGDLMAYWEKYGPPDDCDLIEGKLTCH